MPTYQYRCRDCGDDLEIVQAFTDDALTECPSCGGSLRKVFSAVGISFKGSGFYANDARGSRSSSTPAAASTSDNGSSSSTSDSGSSSSGSSDSSGSSSSSSSSDSGSSSSSSAGSSTGSGSSTAAAAS